MTRSRPASYQPGVDPDRDLGYQQSDTEDADDEQSFSEIDDEYQGYTSRSFRHRSSAPQFPGQDTRPTSSKELAGWYSYGWAAEAFVVCGISSFIPVTMEQLARENGRLLRDMNARCGASDKSGDVAGMEVEQCVVYILGWWVNTTSFAM